MAKKDAKRKSREERLADQARYDEVTRRLRERIESGRPREPQRDDERRASS